MNVPQISIVTVVRNAGNSFEKTILSVIDQTYQNIEYLIIDGQSTDGTLDLIKKYEPKIAYWISEPDKGIYDAMNKALIAANGDWLYFLGADDILANEFVIAEMAKHLVNGNIIYYGDVLFKNRNLLYQFKLSKWNLCYRNISHQSIFYPARCFKHNNYDLLYKVFADHIYNIKLYGQRQFKFEYISLLIALYNDEGTSSNTFDVKYYDNLPSVVKQYLGLQYALYVKLRIMIFRFKLSQK